VHTLGHVAEEGLSNLSVGRILREIDGDEKFLSLLIDVTNVDTTLVSEKNPVALTEGKPS